MNKLSAFVKLDFITIKPYFTAKYILVYVAVAVLTTTISKNTATGIFVGMMLGTMAASYPFSIGEKSNMDALYATLSLSRKNVVLGRYLFMLAFNICTVIFSLATSSAGLFISKLANMQISAYEGFIVIMLILIVYCIVFQSIQLPIFFKLGYAKAKFFRMLPAIIIMISFYALNMAYTSIGAAGADNLFAAAADNIGVISAVVALLMVLIVFVSIKLSFVFYNKREF